jgi:hypothetical protein
VVAPTDLLYTIKINKKNVQAVRQLAIGYVAAWLEMQAENDGLLVKGIDSKEIQAELLRLDVRTRLFSAKDPDTKNVVKLLGLETTEKLVRTFCGDPDDPVWSTR